MLTKSDRQFILEAVAKSRDEQRKERAIERVLDKQEIAEKIKKFEMSQAEIKEKMTQNQDVLIGRLDNIDQELAMTTGHRDMLEDQNTRISALENIHPQGKHAIKTI